MLAIHTYQKLVTQFVASSLCIILIIFGFVFSNVVILNSPLKKGYSIIPITVSEWKVNQQNWPEQAENFFRKLDEGYWKSSDNNNTWAFIHENITLAHVGKNECEDCLKQRWIMMRGDSSLRFLFSSLVQLLGGKALSNDPFMPKYSLCKGKDCGSFITGRHRNHSDRGGQPTDYFREYWSATKSIRITFCFAQSLANKSYNTEQFITESMQPDLLIMEGGPWDYMIYNDTVNQAIRKLKRSVEDVPRYYHGPTMWIDLIACAHQAWTAEFSQKSREVVNMPAMSRHVTTVNLPQELAVLCDGWHGHGQLSDLHRDILLHAMCKI